MNIFDFWARDEYTRQTPGLIRIKKFFDVLKIKPDIPVIHIAGTNGKGTTAHILANFFWKEFPHQNTGLYTSPHLTDITERLVCNGKSISQRELQEISLYYFPLAKKCQLSFFEFLTAIALIWFREKKCFRIILETGLGGTYDATNICQNKILSIITSISYDHQEYLGNTLPEIAREKAGIIKKGMPVILGLDIPGKILPLFRVRTETIWQPGKDFFVSPITEKLKYQIFDYQGRKKIPQIVFRQPGEKSVISAALAIRAAEFLKIRESTVRRVLKNFQLAGRREIICRQKIRMILDGAHNPAALSAFFKDYKRWQNTFLSGWSQPILFFTLVKEKRVLEIARTFYQELTGKISYKKLVIYCLQSNRAQKPSVIFLAFKKYLPEEKMKNFPSLESAICCYKKEIISGTPAIFIGSFYGVGEFKKNGQKFLERSGNELFSGN